MKRTTKLFKHKTFSSYSSRGKVAGSQFAITICAVGLRRLFRDLPSGKELPEVLWITLNTQPCEDGIRVKLEEGHRIYHVPCLAINGRKAVEITGYQCSNIKKFLRDAGLPMDSPFYLQLWRPDDDV